MSAVHVNYTESVAKDGSELVVEDLALWTMDACFTAFDKDG